MIVPEEKMRRSPKTKGIIFWGTYISTATFIIVTPVVENLSFPPSGLLRVHYLIYSMEKKVFSVAVV